MNKYPLLEVNLQNITNNTKTIVGVCSNHNIKISGVIKGFNGILQIVDEMIKGGCEQIASSRIQHKRMN